jgi:peptide/nickel transport system permease protein
MSPARFVAQRAAHALLLLLGATVVVFLLVRIIPGDPAEVMLGDRASPEAVRLLRQSLGLDRPLPAQYALYLRRLLQGDLGASIRAGRPVRDLIAERLPATIRLTLAAVLLAVLIGLPVGVLSAARPRSVLEAGAFVLSLLGQAMPAYWLGLILINVFAVQLA